MDNNTPSPLETLRQLKEWLDAGTITQQEFDTLKRKLLFNEAANAAPSAPSAPTTPTPAPTPPPVTSAPTEPRSTEPPVTEPRVTAPPVEEPLLPPVVDSPRPASVTPVHSTVVPLGSSLGAAPATPNNPTPSIPTTSSDVTYEEPEAFEPEPPRKQLLATVLIIGGILLLLAVVGYLLLGNRKSERLTSSSLNGADTTAVTVEEGPQAQQLDLPPTAAPETVRVQPVIPVQPAATDTAGGAQPAVDPATSEAAIRSRVTQALTSLYNDMEAAPFNASQHFAPQVERFYTLQNTSPQAIEAELHRSHFPEFTEAELSYDPSTLQISPIANDGTVMVTYQERGRSFRKSRNQYQQTVAQVRARVDKAGKLTYFRQERLLENTFTDPKPTTSTPANTPTEEAPPTPQQ